MRVTSLVILLVVVGGVAYLFINSDTRNWILGQGEEAAFQAQGYTLAKTPSQAMEKFLEAIKAKNYKAAARYCQGDYAEQLKKAHSAASGINSEMKKITNIIEDKGYKTDKSTQLIHGMEAFYPYPFKVKEVKHKEPEEKAIGAFIPEPITPPTQGLQPHEVSPLDLKFWNVYPLTPVNLFADLDIKKDKDVWKINFQMRPGQLEAITYLMDKHKGYVTGLQSFRDDLLRDTFLKDRVPSEMISKLAASK